MDKSLTILDRFVNVRNYTKEICGPLEIEDYVVQPTPEVSPPKWHLAHTTWFFEELILRKYFSNYKRFNDKFPELFNSYYKSAGKHWIQAERGNLSRPTVREILEYRSYVDEKIISLLESGTEIDEFIFEVGLHHEQQHQELLFMDIKNILAQNQIETVYSQESFFKEEPQLEWIFFDEGLYEVGTDSSDFHYDNESPKHKIYNQAFRISNRLVTNGEYLEFIESGAYKNHKYWLSSGHDWLEKNKVKAPLYWKKSGNKWYEYDFNGINELKANEPVKHISFYEADAFASWKGMRLPNEYEIEILNLKEKSQLWQWTQSSYAAYPGFKPFDGMIEEYNGKFMCGQYVLRGGCRFTPEGHHRNTYRNFYYPNQRWMFSGIRLCT